MKILLPFLLVIGCQPNPKGAKDFVRPESPDTIVEPIEDTLPEVDYSGISFYMLQSFQFDDQSVVGYIPLSDGYVWQVDSPTFVIEEKWLKNDFENRNYHELTPTNRRRFLDSVFVNPTDTVFAYYFPSGKVYRTPVSEMRVVGFANPYYSRAPYDKYGFMIGLEWDVVPVTELHNAYDYTLIHIGPSNPFEPGLIRMKWKPYQGELSISDSLLKVDRFNVNEVTDSSFIYSFSHQGFEYFAVEYFYKHRSHYELRVRRLLSRLENSSTWLSQHLIYESEGTSIRPLYHPSYESSSDSMVYDNWAGRIIKGMPPGILGMYYESFGCPEVHFVNGQRKSIRCDNRH